MLLVKPWSVMHPSGAIIRVPHPLSYFAQKLLICESRLLAKRTKDLVDALFVLGGFMESLPAIIADRADIEAVHRDGFEHFARAVSQFTFLFGGPRPSGPLQIAMGYYDNPRSIEAERTAAIADVVAREIMRALDTPR
jgi:hypothetical protein